MKDKTADKKTNIFLFCQKYFSIYQPYREFLNMPVHRRLQFLFDKNPKDKKHEWMNESLHSTYFDSWIVFFDEFQMTKLNGQCWFANSAWSKYDYFVFFHLYSLANSCRCAETNQGKLIIEYYWQKILLI